MEATWVVVADSSVARLFSCSKHLELSEVDTLKHPASRLPEQELGTEKPGVALSRGQGQHHGMTPRRTLKQQEADKFAREVVSELIQAHNAGQFTKLIVTAEPAFLGLLRSHYTENLKNAITLEIDKDLSHLSSGQEIRQHLPERF